jgi:hypothetical protein
VASLASTISFSDEDDEMIWQFQPFGVYSFQFMYSVINFRGGGSPIVHSTNMEVGSTPILHFFLWLLSKNKLLTGDNLEKRRQINDRSCLFCFENESDHHLF